MKDAKYWAILLPILGIWGVGALCPLGKLGIWLRELSLSGPAGNVGAWALVLGLAALPGLGLLQRGRSRYDWLLLLASGELLAGLFYLVNPTLLACGGWNS